LQFDAVSVQLAETHTTHTSVALATHRPEDEHSERRTSGNQQPLEILEVNPADSLASLEARAQSWNPRLLQLGHKVAAAEAKADYIDKLPDPTIGTNIFAHPIETASGSQRANLTATQMIPWLKRLDAQSQQAWLEALALRQVYEAERLQVVGDVRTLWYRLYLLGKQLETNRANLEVLRPLVAVANDRVATGAGSARDAWLGNLELGKLGERILTLNQQLESTKAELNLVIGRDTDHPISVPQMLEPSLPDWTHGMLRQIALQQQPEITAAQLQAQATSLGIEVARLKRRPNFSLSASWFAIDDNRPTPSFVDVGRDAWSIGAQMSIPLWPHKYDSIEEEAMWKHSASHASVEEVMRRYDSRLRDLWERAKTAAETAELYKTSLLPQARLALDAGIDSYSNSRVDLDSIVRDFRSLLMLELGYHRAVSELAVALARIQQAVGTDLAIQLEAAPLPAPDEP
jgi:outer membrane protein TolC